MRSLCRALALILLVAHPGCGDRKSSPTPSEPPALRPLDAIPAAARVVVGVNIVRVRDSKLVRYAARELFARDPGLKTRLDALFGDCGLDPANDVLELVVGLGTTADEAVLVASLRADGGRLLSCVVEMVEGAGGEVSVERVRDRDAHHVKMPTAFGTDVWVTLASPRAILVAASRHWLDAALAPDGKLHNNSTLSGLLERVDQTAGVWGAGEVDATVGSGLIELVNGTISAPPAAMFGRIKLSEGFDVELGAVMATPADATVVAEFAAPQLATLALVAQSQGLGRIVSKIRVESEERTAFVRFRLTAEEAARLAEQIDSRAGDEQDTRIQNSGE